MQTPKYYDNTEGSLYIVAHLRGWSPYLFDVVKRLWRGGAKDPYKQELEKSIVVLQLWLSEMDRFNFRKAKQSGKPELVFSKLICEVVGLIEGSGKKAELAQNIGLSINLIRAEYRRELLNEHFNGSAKVINFDGSISELEGDEYKNK
jgi:hypothetical protein